MKGDRCGGIETLRAPIYVLSKSIRRGYGAPMVSGFKVHLAFTVESTLVSLPRDWLYRYRWMSEVGNIPQHEHLLLCGNCWEARDRGRTAISLDLHFRSTTSDIAVYTCRDSAFGSELES